MTRFDLFALALAGVVIFPGHAISPGLLAGESGANRLAGESGDTFVVRHGRDTVAVETFARTGTSLQGTLAIKDSQNTAQRWRAVVAPDATLPLIEVTVVEDREGGLVKAKMRQQTRVIFRGDSVAVDDVTGHGLETRLFGTASGAVPYLNLSFALLEQGVRRARVIGADPLAVPFFNLGGGQTVTARISKLAGDSLSLAIGKVEFHLRMAPDGRLLGGRIPAQDVIVDRVRS